MDVKGEADDKHRRVVIILAVAAIVVPSAVAIAVANWSKDEVHVVIQPLPAPESPTAIPSGREVRTGTPEPFTMRAGTTITLDERVSWVCSGDVAVNGDPIYDNDPNTGLVIVVPQGKHAELLARYGASCHPANAGALTQVRDQWVADMQERGCVSGCDSVDVVEFS